MNLLGMVRSTALSLSHFGGQNVCGLMLVLRLPEVLKPQCSYKLVSAELQIDQC